MSVAFKDGTGQRLYETAKGIIPGGTQLFSKRPERFLPDLWPAYYSRAKGVYVWDLDGNKYLDMTTCGVGSCILGYADPDVERDVVEAIAKGAMSTLNSPEEVELAELLCQLHPWAQMVRFARGGGEAMAVAVRIARASTGRDKIAFCGYHGWHDWYLAANLSEHSALDEHLLPGLSSAGVPRGLADTVLPFAYDAIGELEAIGATHGDNLAAIVMEPARSQEPASGFLEAVREIATRSKAVLIFDEVTSGWRMNTGGIHLTYGVTPEMAVFAKAMSNGYPMAAVIGVRGVMEAAQGSFISSTCWTERIGPAAALATIRKHQSCDVSKHLIGIGSRIQSEWLSAAASAGLSIGVEGIPPLARFSFQYANAREIRTLFTQIMLEMGILATNVFYATYAHEKVHEEIYLTALHKAFSVVARAKEDGKIEKLLKGPVAHADFRRLT